MPTCYAFRNFARNCLHRCFDACLSEPLHTIVCALQADPNFAPLTQEFKRALDLQAECFVIPIICPGYVFPKKIVNGRMTNDINYDAWWPTNMSELKDHALFVNLQNRAEWRSRVELELLPAINSCLSGATIVCACARACLSLIFRASRAR